MAVRDFALSTRPTVLAHVRTSDIELPLAIQSQHRWDVAMCAVQLKMRAGIGY